MSQQRLMQIPDAYRALDLLVHHPRIDAGHIALMGFGTGGGAALYGRLDRFRKIYSSENSRIILFVGLYTPCNISLRDEGDPNQIPVRLFHGDADDRFPIATCRSYVAKLADAGIDIRLKEYHNAHNSFDNPDLKRPVFLCDLPTARECRFQERNRGDFGNADTGAPLNPKDICIRTGVTFAYDREATTAARDDVTSELARAFENTAPKAD